MQVTATTSAYETTQKQIIFIVFHSTKRKVELLEMIK